MEIEKGFQKTDVGIIPSDWNVRRIIDVISNFQNGYAFSSKRYKDIGIPIVTMAQIGLDGSFQFDATKVNYWSFNDLEKLKNFQIKNGDLIIAMTDVTPSKNLIGRMAIVKSDKTLLLNQRVGLLRIHNEKIHPVFLKAFSNSRTWRRYSIASASLGVQANISTRDILNGPIPYPSFEEQNAIATTLTDVETLITGLEKLIAKKRDIKRGALQELLKPKDVWKVKKLGDCLIRNPDYGINAAAVPYNESLPIYLRITDITEDGKYSKQNIVSIDNVYSSKYYLEIGDLVFARTGASVGKTYLYDPNDGKLVFAGFLIRIKTNPEILNPVIFKYYTQTAQYWDWIRANSTRTGQPGINGNEYKKLSLSLPPLIQEQTHIAQILSDMDVEIEALEKKLEKYKMLKQGMMQNLLTGKIRLV